MRITPLDVRKQEFRRSVRGFDCDEVRAFMATLADEYEIVLVDNKQIREKVMFQDEKITEYKSMERTLRDTLMTAEKLMQETRENANKEGDLIVRDAKLKATQILQDCRLRTEELRREIEGLRKEKENYLGRFKSLAESQIQFIESHRTDFKELDDKLTGIVDSVADGVAANAAAAEKEAVVETIVETLIQPELDELNSSSDSAPRQNFSSGPEVDVWRNYSTDKGQEEIEKAPAVDSGGTEQVADAPTNENLAEGNDELNHNQAQPEVQDQDQGQNNEQDKQWQENDSSGDDSAQEHHESNHESGHQEQVTQTYNV